MFITIEKIIFEYTLSKTLETWECSIQRIQVSFPSYLFFSLREIKIDSQIFLKVDNQLPGSTIFVALCPHSSGLLRSTPFFHISVVKSTQYESIDFFLYFSMALQEIDLNLEENFLNSCLSFVKGISQIISPQGPSSTQEDQLIGPVDDKKIYFETFHLFPIKFNLKFIASEKQTDSFFRSVISAVGVTLGNLDGARISLSDLELKHPFSTWSELGNRISKHYYSQFLREFYKVIASFELFGSPVSFFSDLGTGVKEFFSETSVRSPRDFGGIAKGVSNLLVGSVIILSNTAGKISSTLGKGLATLSMDEQYIKEHEMKRKQVPSAVSQGILMGFQDLSYGVSKAISGVLVKYHSIFLFSFKKKKKKVLIFFFIIILR